MDAIHWILSIGYSPLDSVHGDLSAQSADRCSTSAVRAIFTLNLHCKQSATRLLSPVATVRSHPLGIQQFDHSLTGIHQHWRQEERWSYTHWRRTGQPERRRSDEKNRNGKVAQPAHWPTSNRSLEITSEMFVEFFNFKAQFRWILASNFKKNTPFVRCGTVILAALEMQKRSWNAMV